MSPPLLAGDDLWVLVEARAAATPDAEMLVDPGGRRMTFSQYHDRAVEVAAGLAAAGVRRGDVVAWELPTWIETVLAAGALHRLGTVQVPIIAIYRDREVTHACRQSGARWLLTPGEFRGFDFAAMAERIAGEVGVRPLVVERGALPSGDPGTLASPAARGGPGWIFYTSGTTSEPKGARHADAALAWVGGQMATRMQVEAGDRYALVFPFPHVGGILLLFMSLRAGSASLLEDTFDPATTPAFLAREGVTHAGTGTPFHLAYLAAQRARADEPLFPRLKCCPGGAAPKPPSLHAQVKAELGGAGIVSSWGLTEAPILTFSAFDDGDDKLSRTEGRALDGVELRTVAVGATGPGAAGEEGELQARGPQVMQGYVDVSLDADAFTEDGWFRTGDLGIIDADGFVVITGRLKDVIIRNGENISAKEVEDLLFTHPGIGDVAVVGLPDERTGERVCAVVVPASGDAVATGAVPTLDALARFLVDAGLRRQAVPEQLETVDALPRNPAGKVTKAVLQARFSRGPA